MSTTNYGWTEVPGGVAPDVPYWANRALRQADLTVKTVDTKATDAKATAGQIAATAAGAGRDAAAALALAKASAAPTDAAVAALIAAPGSATAKAMTGYVRQIAPTGADPLNFLNNVSLLCEFPVRENGETQWPQGISLNTAANEIYVSNSDGPAAQLRIDIRDLTTGARKSSRLLNVQSPTWSEALPWWKDTAGNLCFMIRTEAGTSGMTSYCIHNYTQNYTSGKIAIQGPFKADVSNGYLVTSDAYGKTATKFYLYTWDSIKAGTPVLVATIPLENPGNTAGKTQAIAIVGGYLYIVQGEPTSSPSILVYDFTGKFITLRTYQREDFRAAVNKLKPGYLTNPDYLYECEGATNLDGRLVTAQIVNNTPKVTAAGKVLVLQHNRIDGVPIAAAPNTDYIRDTGWLPFILEAGWTAGGSITPAYRRVGAQVFFRGNIVNNSAALANVYTSFGTLPAGFRPPGSFQYPVTANTTTAMNCRVNAGGTVEMWSSIQTAAWRCLGGITYLLD